MGDATRFKGRGTCEGSNWAISFLASLIAEAGKRVPNDLQPFEAEISDGRLRLFDWKAVDSSLF